MIRRKIMIIVIIAGGLAILAAAAFVVLGFGLPSLGDFRTGEADRFIETEGFRIRYRVREGADPAIVMLHGFGGDLSDWGPLMEKPIGLRMYALDLIGFGLSAKPRLRYDLETQRHFLLSFMDALGIPKAVLMGSSMGGSIALWTAAKSPERVDGVIAFAPSAYPGSMRHAWPGGLFYRPGLLNRIALLLTRTRLFGTLFPKSLGRQALESTASYDKAFADVLPSIRQTVLLVWSRSDRRVPFSYSERYKELLPNVRFVEARPESGHGAASDPTPEILDGIRKLALDSRGSLMKDS